MNKHRVFISMVVSVTMILAACGSDGDSFTQLNALSGEPDQPVTNGVEAESVRVGNSVPVAQPRLQERVVIKDASLRLVVTNPAEKLREITQLAADLGGWVVSSNTTRSETASGDERIFGDILIRVPSEMLDSALEQIKTNVVSVEAENITGQDVTQEFIDLTGRLTNLQAAESQLQQIMDAADETEDVLAVHAELVRIRGDIETTQGRLQFIQESAAFSSIRVQLNPEPQESILNVNQWRPGRTVEDAFAALIDIVQFLINALIVLVIVGIPLLVLVGLPARYGLRYMRARRPVATSDGDDIDSNID